eukprot:Phypoly_transcript_03311.p1 GENE.Phypoly_transcript_03311~~Phypoly_transcript_03311.p1  ORF type:complete len:722 (+),score=144.11 Phypoly_transcript_03311:157-2322(+)
MTEALVKQYLLAKKAAIQWIQNVLPEESLHGLKDDLFQHLVDGVTLCKVMQKIAPNLIPRIKMPVMKKRATLTVFKTSENVSFFLQACEEIGVPRQKRFVLHDLVAKKGDAIAYSSSKRVMECLEALCELANADKKYNFSVKWPVLDPSKVVFTKDELQTARHMVEEHQKTEEKKEGAEKKFLMSPNDDAKKKELIKNKAAAKLQAVVRGWLARNRYRTMLRSQAYRDHVAQEILSTERVYVEHLEFLVKEVILPLRSAVGTSSQILTDPEIRVIFSETESILNYNRHLLLQLEERVSKWSVSQRLGDIFLLISNFLKIYTQYCSNYSEAMRILSECKKQSKFKKFLDELKKKCHDIEHRGIEDYLIRPVQRIPRYYLLLQDLVKHTSKDHPDYANLASAAQKVQAVAEYMNGKKREAENIMKVTEVQEMIEGDIEPLAKPHRRFVKEGQLHEIGKGTARKVAVVLFLFNDMLVITKVQGTSFLSRNKTQKLHYHNNFGLVGTQTISLENSTVFQHGFQVLRLKSKRSVTLLASSEESKAEWIEAINAEIKGATQQEQAHDKRTEHAVKDKVATNLDKITQQYSHTGITSPPPASPRGSFILTSSGSPSASPEPPHSPSGGSGSVINLFKGSAGNGSSSNLHNSASSASVLSSASTSSLTNSGGSDQEGEVKRMSVREKRMQLMHQARRSGSIPNSPSMTSSTSLNGDGKGGIQMPIEWEG